MKKLWFGLFLGLVLAAVPSTAFAQLSAFQGNWRNNDPATGGVTRLQIATSPNAPRCIGRSDAASVGATKGTAATKAQANATTSPDAMPHIDAARTIAG